MFVIYIVHHYKNDLAQWYHDFFAWGKSGVESPSSPEKSYG
jgi:hypothetical protein